VVSSLWLAAKIDDGNETRAGNKGSDLKLNLCWKYREKNKSGGWNTFVDID
jgi:hypothetical protein